MGIIERVQRAKRALRDGWFVVHFIVVAVPAWFCFVLAVNPAAFTANPAFLMMSAIMSERAWAVICGIAALIGLAPWLTRSNGLFLVSSMVLAAWHGLIALCFLQSNVVTTGSGTYAILALAATIKMLERAHASPHGP